MCVGDLAFEHGVLHSFAVVEAGFSHVSEAFSSGGGGWGRRFLTIFYDGHSDAGSHADLADFAGVDGKDDFIRFFTMAIRVELVSYEYKIFRW